MTPVREERVRHEETVERSLRLVSAKKFVIRHRRPDGVREILADTDLIFEARLYPRLLRESLDDGGRGHYEAVEAETRRVVFVA